MNAPYDGAAAAGEINVQGTAGEPRDPSRMMSSTGESDKGGVVCETWTDNSTTKPESVPRHRGSNTKWVPGLVVSQTPGKAQDV